VDTPQTQRHHLRLGKLFLRPDESLKQTGGGLGRAFVQNASINSSAHEIVGSRDRVNITRQVQVHILEEAVSDESKPFRPLLTLHGNHLRVASSRRSTLDAKRGSL
jgi:hypothetical protein